MHACVAWLFQGVQVQLAPQERQISKSAAYPHISQASLHLALPITMNKELCTLREGSKTSGFPSSHVCVNASATGECPQLRRSSSQRKYSSGEMPQQGHGYRVSRLHLLWHTLQGLPWAQQCEGCFASPCVTDLPQLPGTAFTMGSTFKAMLRWAMEKQVFHRCNQSYLSCLGLCEAVAANLLHSKWDNFACTAGGITGCRKLHVQGPDRGG